MSLLEWLIERTRSRTKKFGGDRPISLLVQRRPKASKDRSSFPSVIYKPERLPGPRVRMCKEGLITRRKRWPRRVLLESMFRKLDWTWRLDRQASSLV